LVAGHALLVVAQRRHAFVQHGSQGPFELVEAAGIEGGYEGNRGVHDVSFSGGGCWLV
jgi:hypothetical protein